MSRVLPSVLARPQMLGSPRRVARVSTQATGQGQNLTIPLGRPGACPGTPQMTTTIHDDSLSMLGGNDSAGTRYLECGIAFEQLGRRCCCGHDLGAVLHMSTPTSANRPPTPLKGRSRRDLISGLRVPTDSDGASLLRGTLRLARQMVDLWPDHQHTLVVFSDFQLFDDDLDGLWAELAAFPATVHAVVLRAQPPSALMADARITVTAVPPGQPPGAVARALFDALVLRRPGAEPQRRSA